MSHLLAHFSAQLDQWKQQGNFRQFTSNCQQDRYIHINDQKMLNLASNDYLGLNSDLKLREQFFDETPNDQRWMSSTSSRLLTGNFPEYDALVKISCRPVDIVVYLHAESVPSTRGRWAWVRQQALQGT